jgi:uncharacterized protein (UPF0303 family)
MKSEIELRKSMLAEGGFGMDKQALERDIKNIAEQERLLTLGRFGPEDAWAIGALLREAAVAQKAPVAIDISLRDRVLFHCVLPGSTTDNAEWIRRKRNTVLRLWRSSYAVGRRLELAGMTQEAGHNLPLSDYAVHGGAFPISLEGLGCVGAITVSGLPQRLDHNMVADALARFANVDLGEARLSE